MLLQPRPQLVHLEPAQLGFTDLGHVRRPVAALLLPGTRTATRRRPAALRHRDHPFNIVRDRPLASRAARSFCTRGCRRKPAWIDRLGWQRRRRTGWRVT